MTEKTIGYLLLGVGLIIMTFAVIQIIMVFTGRATPIHLFEAEEQSQNSLFDMNDLMQQLNQNNPNSDIQMQPQIPQLMNPDSLNRILNLTVYYFIMQFLLGFGYKLASLGVQLVRPLKVEMKNRELTSEKTS